MLRKIFTPTGITVFTLGFAVGGAIFSLLTTYCFVAAYNGNIEAVRDTFCVAIAAMAGGWTIWKK